MLMFMIYDFSYTFISKIKYYLSVDDKHLMNSLFDVMGRDTKENVKKKKHFWTVIWQFVTELYVSNYLLLFTEINCEWNNLA